MGYILKSINRKFYHDHLTFDNGIQFVHEFNYYLTTSVRTIFFYYLLPPIIYSGGYNLQKKRFFKYFYYISIYGVISTLLSFGCTAVLTYLIQYFFSLKIKFLICKRFRHNHPQRSTNKIDERINILLFRNNLCDRLFFLLYFSIDSVAALAMIK